MALAKNGSVPFGNHFPYTVRIDYISQKGDRSAFYSKGQWSKMVFL